MKKVKIGTRGSRLALAQTKWVTQQLNNYYPTLEFEIRHIQTKGDLIQNVSLEKIGDKGLFVKEIEQQLLSKEIDLAIHSMKDMPSVSPSGLTFAVMPKREDARDVLVLRASYKRLADLPVGATIGTGSKRRKYQLLNLRPDLNIIPIRGNIETRMAKIAEDHLDGVILAAAGLIRGGYQNRITEYLPVDKFIPAPAQGALALQIREGDHQMADLLQVLANEQAQIEVAAERGFLRGVEGTCHEPIGAKAVDPDDVTPTAIKEAGAKILTYGTPVLPGSMLLVGYLAWGFRVVRCTLLQQALTYYYQEFSQKIQL